MELRRLAWAGLEIEVDGQIAAIDFVEDFKHLRGEEPPPGEIPAPPADGSVDVALLTHLHSDHADIDALGRVLRPGAKVLRPELAFGEGAEVAMLERPEAALAASGLATEVVEPWRTVEVGPFEIAALPAADGFGDPQVSWAVRAGGRSVLHAGDTVFHGWWWLSALRHGPFDVAFLPAGGAVADFSARQPASPLPAGMDPGQAAIAAQLLGARQAVPMHYGPIHEDANYVQADDPGGSFEAAARELGVDARVLRPGESLSI